MADEKKRPRVLGWTTFDEHNFVGNKCNRLGYGGTDKEDEAVAEDIRAHGYFFSGNEHQDGYDCAPVLDDYRMIRYSTRHFGWVMAKAHGEDPKKNYSAYAWNFGMDRKDLVRPTGKRTLANVTPPKTEFSVPKSLYREMFEASGYATLLAKRISETGDKNYLLTDEDKYTDSFYDDNMQTNLFLLPVLPQEGSYYWLEDIVTIVKENVPTDFLTATIRQLLCYDTVEDFLSEMEWRKDDEKFVYRYDKSEIRRVAEKGRFLLLGLDMG
ncbi:MAG: hypothetical protein IJ735_03295 [Clostridia bacterium]|nr:hypothetical protein [Clostridia bacterium]